MRSRSVALLALAILSSAASAAPARAREWFVRAGAEGGDGSQAKPFADPWMALEKCEAGDVIHVTGGKYFGKLNEGTWNVPFDNVQLIGGYDNDFKTRDPWTNRTELKWDDTSKNWPRGARLTALNAKNVVVDGFVIDQKDQNKYTDPEKTGRNELMQNNAMEFNQAATVRNCVIVNPGFYGVRCPPGSTVENNLILNAIDWGVDIYTNTGDFKNNTAQVKNNTIIFSWCFKSPGQGRYSGSGIHINGPTNVTNNIIALNDNQAIYQTYPAEKVSITKNVFHMNLWANLKFFVEGRDVSIDNKSMEMLEEVGLKAFDGNEIADPQLALDKDWLDQVSKRTAPIKGKVVMDDWNKTRQLLGLPLIGTGGKAPSGIAPVYDLDKAFDLLTPKNDKVKAGARRIKLDSKVTGGSAAAAAKEYPKGVLLDWHKSADTVTGKPMEMIVAVGGVANISSMPEQYKKDQILGFFLYDPDGKGERVTGFMMKGTNAERVCNAATGRYDGRGKPETLFVARGIAYHIPLGVPKAAFFVESIEKFEAAGPATDARPKGRDWFVRAGSMGGNGTKEKPYRDPFQALEKCESGDTIHVTEGEYVGKLKIGTWRIDTSFIALYGGYNKEFTERNPWKYPSLLYCPEDFKGRRGGYTIDGDTDDHTGAIVDGFVFDKKLNNFYKADGDIEASRSDNKEAIWLHRPGSTVRNCIFVNQAGGALRMCNGSVIENNIIVNSWGRGGYLSKGHTTHPAIFRNNTILFAWDIKAGTGNGRTGECFRFETDVRAVIDNNIFAFSDNDGLKFAVEPNEIVLTNNAFSHNLWSHVMKTTSTVVVDAANWKQLGDLGFKKSEGNEILAAGIPLDQKWFDTYLNRTAYEPGKVKMDEWNQLREMMGQPVLATGGKGPEGLMRAYDWKHALTLFPKNPKCKAGARIVELPVKFEGVERKEETHEYAETTWDSAKDRPKWDALKDKRVSLKVSMRPIDNQYQLEDVTEAQYTAFQVHGPDGTDSGGLPMRCYIKKGTKYERVVKNAKDATRGKPEETYIIKGIARQNRNMVVEIVERAE